MTSRRKISPEQKHFPGTLLEEIRPVIVEKLILYLVMHKKCWNIMESLHIQKSGPRSKINDFSVQRNFTLIAWDFDWRNLFFKDKIDFKYQDKSILLFFLEQLWTAGLSGKEKRMIFQSNDDAIFFIFQMRPWWKKSRLVIEKIN